MENQEPVSLSDRNMYSESKLQSFDMQMAIQKIKQDDLWQSGSKRTIPLLKSPELSIILLALPKNAEIPNHQASGRITVQVLEGELVFNAEGETVILKKAGLLSLSKQTNHSLKALEDTFFLLTKLNA